jgi:hypothetical protein
MLAGHAVSLIFVPKARRPRTRSSRADDVQQFCGRRNIVGENNSRDDQRQQSDRDVIGKIGFQPNESINQPPRMGPQIGASKMGAVLIVSTR